MRKIKMKMPKVNMQKLLVKPLIRAFPTTLIAVVLMAVLGIALTSLAAVFGMLGQAISTLMMGIVAYVLFVIAKQTHRGQEDIVTMIPTLILVSTIAAVLATIFPVLALAFEINTVAALAMSLVVIYFAEEYSRMIVK